MFLVNDNDDSLEVSVRLSGDFSNNDRLPEITQHNANKVVNNGNSYDFIWNKGIAEGMNNFIIKAKYVNPKYRPDF